MMATPTGALKCGRLGDNEPSHLSDRCPQDVSVASSPSCLSSLFFV
jgi:hypothetical protein